MNAMYGTIAVNDIRDSNHLEKDYSLIYNEMSDEELEVAAQGLQASWGSFGGWMSSTPQCCSPYEL
jgi:hypothetical protein